MVFASVNPVVTLKKTWPVRSVSLDAEGLRSLVQACAKGVIDSRWPDPAVIPNEPPAEGEPYGRKALHRDDSGEVLVVRWRDGMACAPHDHAEASGFVYLLSGTLYERTWRFANDDLACGRQRVYRAPAVVRVRAGCIHDMRAEGGGLSVHVYIPPTSGMHVFDLSRREILRVTDDCGAWIPREPQRILSREPW